MFVDHTYVHLRAGSGGDGCVSLLREACRPRGGPDGGDGGRGGSIFIQASEHEHSLEAFRYLNHYAASNGEPGSSKNRHGANADDLVLHVPCGTLVKDQDQGGMVIADLIAGNEPWLAARGGRGGRGNARFASSINQAPRHATPGTPGEERQLELELKTIADVGLVGYPNAGKSTFLAAISNARPQTAAYPFTTLFPTVGIVQREDYHRFTIADIPGLIEDAHANVGLGHEFLRHIERTRVLLYVIDIAAVDGVAPWRQLHSLQHELDCYQSGMSRRPALIVANKIDEAAADENLATLRSHTELPIFPVCAILEEGTAQVLTALDGLLAGLAP